VLKHGVALRVWLGHLSDPATLRRTVAEHRESAQRMLDEVGAARAVAEHDPAWAYPAMIERWGERYWAGERDAADALLRRPRHTRGSTAAAPHGALSGPVRRPGSPVGSGGYCRRSR